MANATHKDIRRVNDLTRAHAAHFIAALSVGLFGSVLSFPLYKKLPLILQSCCFVDLGQHFTCVDPTGEQPLSGMITSISHVRPPFSSSFPPFPSKDSF